VCEELHLNRNGSVTLTHLAPAAGNIEREAPRIVSARLGVARRSEDVADMIKRLDVRHWVRSRCSADWALVHKNDVGNPLYAGLDYTCSESWIGILQRRSQCLEQALVNQSGFSGPRNPGDAGHRAERDFDIHILEIVLRCISKLEYFRSGGPAP